MVIASGRFGCCFSLPAFAWARLSGFAGNIWTLRRTLCASIELFRGKQGWAWRISSKRPMREGAGAPSRSGIAGAQFRSSYLPDSTDWLGRARLAANKKNDYEIDREEQRTASYTGISGIFLQDQAVTESMGPIYNRSNEHLGDLLPEK